MNGEPSIEERVERGTCVALEYMNSHPDYNDQGVDINEDALTDCIADLLHTAKSKGLNARSIHRMALIHFESES